MGFVTSLAVIGEEMTNSKVHVCKGRDQSLYTVENRGEGWYLYRGADRGANQIKFCPHCGKSVEEFNEDK